MADVTFEVAKQVIKALRANNELRGDVIVISTHRPAHDYSFTWTYTKKHAREDREEHKAQATLNPTVKDLIVRSKTPYFMVIRDERKRWQQAFRMAEADAKELAFMLYKETH